MSSRCFFFSADKAVVIEPNIEVYKELKLRMLNATHTLTCGLACLCGSNTVKDGMGTHICLLLSPI